MNAQGELVIADLEATRARAAAEEEQLAALKAATARGRQLSEEYNRQEAAFREVNDKLQTYHVQYEVLSERAGYLIGSEPNTNEDFPSEEAQERWERSVDSVMREQAELQAECATLLALREQYRTSKHSAWSVLEQHRLVVHNLRNKTKESK